MLEDYTHPLRDMPYSFFAMGYSIFVLEQSQTDLCWPMSRQLCMQLKTRHDCGDEGPSWKYQFYPIILPVDSPYRRTSKSRSRDYRLSS